MKAARKDFTPTNLTVLTSDHKLYCVPVRYQENPDYLVYPFSDTMIAAGTVYPVICGAELTPRQVEAAAKELAAALPDGRYHPVKKHRMTIRFQGVQTRSNVLFFSYHIRNDSYLPFEMHITRFYERDRKQTKRSSYAEKEMKPLYVYSSSGEIINGKSTTTLVVAFDQFTITDHKWFTTELLEKNGDRQLTIHVSGKTILQATPW